MAALVVAAALLRRKLDPLRVLAGACLLVMVTDPLAILLPGFQLSFAAVALLIWSSKALRVAGNLTAVPRLDAVLDGIRGLGALQVGLLLGLFPLTAALFGRTAWLAIPVNLLVLPVFNFIAVPGVLLGMLLHGPASLLGDAFLNLGYHGIRLVLAIVAVASELPYARIQLAALDSGMIVASLVAAAASMLPRCWPCRHVAWIALVAVIMHRPERPPADCFDIHILDVGQGLATVVVTTNHVLVYDTGPAFRGGNDTGRLVVAPFLRSMGITSVDTLIISHGDLDHAGGAATLQALISIDRIVTGERHEGPGGTADRCLAGWSWQWDGAGFLVIHPSADSRFDGNDASCVVAIRTGSRGALLTGDIESPAEQLLVHRQLVRSVDLVVVPHHGSATSSSRPFVEAVNPRTAVVSSGYKNRWGLPKQDVVTRWQAAGASLLSTARSGAISQRICAQGPLNPVRQARQRASGYWRQ